MKGAPLPARPAPRRLPTVKGSVGTGPAADGGPGAGLRPLAPRRACTSSRALRSGKCRGPRIEGMGSGGEIRARFREAVPVISCNYRGSGLPP